MQKETQVAEKWADASRQGPVLGRYEIRKELNSGAQARAYLALDRESGREVFVKKLALDQVEGWKSFELFQREIEALKRLNHPRIPRYLDSFSSGDKDFYLVQEFIAAPSLGELLKEGKRLRNGEILDVGLQILDILQYLRTLQPAVVHRDIKPSNILYRGAGGDFFGRFRSRRLASEGARARVNDCGQFRLHAARATDGKIRSGQ